jgi:hypothetical protein
MTEIVRASLGLPTLRAGPQFQNPKPLHHLKIREFQTCFGHWILEFVIYLRFGAWDLLFEKLVLRVLDFINPSIPKQLAIFTGKTI